MTRSRTLSEPETRLAELQLIVRVAFDWILSAAMVLPGLATGRFRNERRGGYPQWPAADWPAAEHGDDRHGVQSIAFTAIAYNDQYELTTSSRFCKRCST